MDKYNNTFNTKQANIEKLIEEESDLSELDGQSHADSFFLLKDNYQGLKPKDNTAEQTLLYNEKKEEIHAPESIHEKSGPP